MTKTQLDDKMVLMTSKSGAKDNKDGNDVKRENPLTEVPLNWRDHHCLGNKVHQLHLYVRF